MKRHEAIEDVLTEILAVLFTDERWANADPAKQDYRTLLITHDGWPLKITISGERYPRAAGEPTDEPGDGQ